MLIVSLLSFELWLGKSILHLSGSLSYKSLSSSVCFLLFFILNYVLVEALGSVYTNPINVKSSGSLLMHIHVHTQTKQGNIYRFREQSIPD